MISTNNKCISRYFGQIIIMLLLEMKFPQDIYIYTYLNGFQMFHSKSNLFVRQIVNFNLFSNENFSFIVRYYCCCCCLYLFSAFWLIQAISSDAWKESAKSTEKWKKTFAFSTYFFALTFEIELFGLKFCKWKISLAP